MNQCGKCGCDLIVGETCCPSRLKRHDLICKSCFNARARLWRAKNKDKIRKQNRTIGSLYSKYNCECKRRKCIEFELSKTEFALLISSPCYYCGELQEHFNGIDRVDNAKGYTTENSVSCCEWCNRMKLTFTKEQFINKCKQIAEKQKVMLYGTR